MYYIILAIYLDSKWPMHKAYFITADYISENSASVFDIIYSTVFCFCCIQIQAMKDLQSWAPIYRLRKVHTYMGQCWNKSTYYQYLPTYLLRYLEYVKYISIISIYAPIFDRKVIAPYPKPTNHIFTLYATIIQYIGYILM